MDDFVRKMYNEQIPKQKEIALNKEQLEQPTGFLNTIYSIFASEAS